MLKFYCFFSIVITLGAIYNSFNVHKQFYPSVLYLSTNKINRSILLNFIVMIVSTFIMTFLRMMFGELKEIEKISVIDKTKKKILEVAYLLFFFYHSLDWQFIFLIFWLMALSIIHWIAIKRAGFLIAESQINFRDNVKLLLTFILLFVIDIKISLYFFYGTEEKFQNMLLGFEFILLPIRIALPFIKHVVNLFEILTLSQFDTKAIIFCGLDVLKTLFKLGVQILLFQYVLNSQGFLLILFVDGVENAYAMFNKIKVFYNQVKLIRMIERIQDVEKIDSHDSTCLICLNELENGKKLSCGHIYHKSCLKTWIAGNSNQFCPKCKKPIQLEEIKIEGNDSKTKILKKQILLQELSEIRSNIQLLKILNQCRNIQNHIQYNQGIGNTQYALPCEALQQYSGVTEIKRLQINYMNKIMNGIDKGIIENHQIPK
ncbi:unnamed protein product (macronuclear) [Paramecium tetraurelia]|uniref:RING-type domain-containing protein n=1 Tax=Paramecium tetraurelia TaxID=5888 RepID=A0D8G2_PARTE|nr:uncharacterized protein GSPATT00014275001 [Paramecium tetraurelia]CAK79329.1 unnamed protein product [Paramecium tetraurelia]|eukprot:XP_001446726.1 hypothetical protein (macronuclear) [Paramecium tetraurelia strain d4-2]